MAGNIIEASTDTPSRRPGGLLRPGTWPSLRSVPQQRRGTRPSRGRQRDGEHDSPDRLLRAAAVGQRVLLRHHAAGVLVHAARPRHARSSWVQAVVPMFLISQAIGQMAFGPVSDRFGRRPVILAGWRSTWRARSIAHARRTSIGAVHVGRAAQGFGSACGIAVGRAVLRDVSHGAGAGAGHGAGDGDLRAGADLGAAAWATGWWRSGGWRAIFLGMAVFAGLLLAFGAAALQGDQRDARRGRAAARPAAALARPHRDATGSRATSCWWRRRRSSASSRSSPTRPRFFKSAFGIEGLQFALLFAATGLGIVLGQIANNRVIARARRAGDDARGGARAAGGDGG